MGELSKGFKGFFHDGEDDMPKIMTWYCIILYLINLSR